LALTMTRSFKTNPVVGWSGARSDKPFKVSERRKERHQVRQVIQTTGDDTDRRLHGDNWGNPAMGPKDGKAWCGGHPSEAKALRK
jgi:hypothetical protein